MEKIELRQKIPTRPAEIITKTPEELDAIRSKTRELKDALTRRAKKSVNPRAPSGLPLKLPFRLG